MFGLANDPDPNPAYANYLRTCAMAGLSPVPRERALRLIHEWTEVLSGRPGSRGKKTALDLFC